MHTLLPVAIVVLGLAAPPPVERVPVSQVHAAAWSMSFATTPAAPDTTQRWDEDAWTPIYRTEGVALSYLFYPEARGDRNGVVVRIRNRNAHPICYRFTIIFRGPATEREAYVRGSVPPHTLRTGDDAGLFWTPFDDDERIGEIGLRGLRVVPRCS
ncbi:MAG: hypothetical protein PPP56_02025 [Longimonas sp.]|uniref:hypothetical protein n=1 Tax=Longimonas sp. TaxID=2039626 RepID=UPI00334E132B